jgi:hypothetical protein
MLPAGITDSAHLRRVQMDQKIDIKKTVLGTVAYVVISFIAQALNHFVVNKAHYASIPFMRAEPIMALGIFTMILQGVILSYVFLTLHKAGATKPEGLNYGLLMGLFLGSYIALVEPSKYMAPSVSSWIAVEGMTSLLQFGIFGVVLAVINNK